MFLISHHDDPSEEFEMLHDQKLDVLVAADSLSWLNFSAPNYFNGREARGIPGLIDKMDFMLRKLPERFWVFIPEIKLREPQVAPYLRERVAVISKERGFAPPLFKRS